MRQGSVSNLNRGRSGRKALARTTESIAKVKAAVSNDPSKSIRKLAQEVNGSYSTVWRILRKDLGLTPCKVTIHHQLTASDQEQRVNFARWFSQNCESDSAFSENIWLSDGAHFHLDSAVNTQNCRIWATERPDVVLERPPQREGHSVVCLQCQRRHRPILVPVSGRVSCNGHQGTVRKDAGSLLDTPGGWAPSTHQHCLVPTRVGDTPCLKHGHRVVRT